MRKEKVAGGKFFSKMLRSPVPKGVSLWVDKQASIAEQWFIPPSPPINRTVSNDTVLFIFFDGIRTPRGHFIERTAKKLPDYKICIDIAGYMW